MLISVSQLESEYRLANKTWEFIKDYEATYHLPYMILFAVGSRETNLHNIIGDGGHGHGVWQLDDRSHTIPSGFMSNVSEQCRTASQMLHSLIEHYRSMTSIYVAAAMAAYNAGEGTVDYNLSHHLNVDIGTANGNYSADTYERLITLQRLCPAGSGMYR